MSILSTLESTIFPSTLSAFQSNLKDVLRPNRFAVIINYPQAGFAYADWFSVKGASLPGRTVGEHEQHWQGVKYKILCDSTYNDVNIVFWNAHPDRGAIGGLLGGTTIKGALTSAASNAATGAIGGLLSGGGIAGALSGALFGGAALRDKFEAWFDFISNDKNSTKANHSACKGEVNIIQLGRNGTPIKTYTLHLAQPKEISDIELNMDNPDQVEEFTVTFSYSYFTTANGLGVSPLLNGIGMGINLASNLL